MTLTDAPPDIDAIELDRLFDELELIDPGPDAVLEDGADEMTLERVPANACHFPVGLATASGRATFCAMPSAPGKSLCAVHWARSWTRPRPRNRRELQRTAKL